MFKRKTSEHSRPPKALLSTPEPDNGQRRLQADRLYQQACVFHRRGRLDQAIALYQEVIKIDPEHQNARFNMGAAYLQTGAYDQAYYIMSDLHLKDPDNRQVTLNLAIAAIGRRQFNDALDLLDKAAAGQMSPSFEIALHKGIVYKHLNQPGVALDWYKRAEAMRPDDPRLLFNVAVVLDQQQRYSEAIDYYTRYIEHTTDKKDAEALQVRRRIRILRAYRAPENPKESITQ